MSFFHKEGYALIIGSTILLTGVVTAAFIFLSPLIAWFTVGVSVVLWGLILQFFRNPTRHTQATFGDIIAPVDGKVVVIEEVMEEEYLKKKCIQVSIFMSPFNVHVCRYPLTGVVKYTKYHPGKFLVAWHPKSSTLNERTTVVVEQIGTQVLFRQVAGALARRIVLYSKKNDVVRAGNDYGFIKFGSRVDIFLPLQTEINITLDQKTKGGITKIATLKKVYE